MDVVKIDSDYDPYSIRLLVSVQTSTPLLFATSLQPSMMAAYKDFNRP